MVRFLRNYTRLILDCPSTQVHFEAEVFCCRYALVLPSFVESVMDAVARSGSATAAVEFFGLQTSKMDQVLCSSGYLFPAVELGNIKGGEVVPKQPACALSSVQQVRKKERMETIVCLLIALEAATSTNEVAS
ncbi:unnamed protein product [Taenia asiatica]|uniref:PCI domain-containing protein n=1 Tax=Taenia asiatica TaxID=60517 RepID=A0A0R3W078_TAEAS|nr:unnamed protein product [Taenia asiatica]